MWTEEEATPGDGTAPGTAAEGRDGSTGPHEAAEKTGKDQTLSADQQKA